MIILFENWMLLNIILISIKVNLSKSNVRLVNFIKNLIELLNDARLISVKLIFLKKKIDEKI